MQFLPVCSENMKAYFERLNNEFEKAHELAKEARAKGADPQPKVEIAIAEDMAGRVEGLVGPQGIAARIRELLSAGKDREIVSLEIAREIMEGKHGARPRDEQLEQAMRTSLALFTEGVQCAPLKGEGLSRVKVQRNPDNSEYVALYYAGPIRGAGAAASGFVAICADVLRQMAGIANYRATEDEVERAVEDIQLYAARTRGGQYVPSDDEVRHIMRNCNVCISGEPSEDYDVTKHKNIPSIESNRVRGGFYLVIAEGICLRATQIIQLAKRAGLDWSWMEKLIKVVKQDSGAKKIEVKPVDSYLAEIVAGRPIFSYPMRAGGFSLRYGRTRFTGIASKSLHPASMEVLQEFPAFGTQFRIERPGKACVIMPCETIRGPVVLLEDGEVRAINDYDQAIAVRGRVKEILFLGEMLIPYGDFSKFKHPLIPGAWCEEWMRALLKSKGIEKSIGELQNINVDDAFELASAHDVPLAPAWTYAWHDLSLAQLQALAEWLGAAKATGQDLELPHNASKRALEIALVPHKVRNGNIILEEQVAKAVLRTLGISQNENIPAEKFRAAVEEMEKTTSPEEKESEGIMRLLNLTSGIEIKRFAGSYIGTRMGRPEKAKERKMQPAVNLLFPISDHGGKMRSLTRAVKTLKANDAKLEVDLALRLCTSCGRKSFQPKCITCGTQTILRARCLKCESLNEPIAEKCVKCDSTALRRYEKQVLDLPTLYEAAVRKVGTEPADVKAVIGLFSSQKIPEPIEKGLLRAKHGIAVFRDGTARFDGTEIPITHFVPSELGVPLQKIKELGYTKDVHGAPLTADTQVVELIPQDIIIPYNCGEYFLRVARFVDDLLVYFYGLKPFYNCKRPEDLVGHQMIALAPHVSAGSLSRVIGFTKARGLLMHPYVHCAERRNCDGDEIGVLLLMDALLNFSLSYLPETRGGKMDEPLVLTTILDPNEIDDEVHKMEVVKEYPLELWLAAERVTPAGEVKVETVAKRLRSIGQYEGLHYSHESAMVGPTETRYIKFKNMRQKVEEELDLMLKIRAVDAQNAAERIILSHFFPDLYGNLHSFSKQNFRCVDCNTIFRRVPLTGTCKKCGGKLILTINRGGIQKYLQLSIDMANRYGLPLYVKQRLQLLEKEIASVFEDDKAKQFSLSEFV